MSQDSTNLMTPAEPLLFEYIRYSPDQSQSKMLMNHKNIDQLLDDDFLHTTRQILIDGIAIEALKGLPDKNEIPECCTEKLRETIKKSFCEYIETTLYQNLESQLLKKEFPSRFNQVIRNFSHSFGGRMRSKLTHHKIVSKKYFRFFQYP